MSIKTLDEKKRQQVLLIVGVGILLVVAVILYFGVWKGEAPTKPISGQELEQDKIANLILEEKLKKINLDFTFLIETILPFLKSHGELPVEVIESGRSNPFTSY